VQRHPDTIFSYLHSRHLFRTGRNTRAWRVEISWHGFRRNFLNYVTSPEYSHVAIIALRFPYCAKCSRGARSSANNGERRTSVARPRISLGSLLPLRHRCTPRSSKTTPDGTRGVSAPGLRDRNNGRYGECNVRAST